MADEHVPQAIWDHELAALARLPEKWLWDGFVAGGNLTLLTSQWKAGKTTLLSVLLSRRKGPSALAGLEVTPGKTVVVTEESPAKWAERAALLDFGGQVCFFSRPFTTIPSLEAWESFLKHIGQVRAEHGSDLLVIDPLAPLMRNENNARSIFETLLPLRALTNQGMAVLALHHPSKKDRVLGQAARGSGALLGHADISIEIRHPGGNPLTRRRQLFALSRHDRTPRQLLIELIPEGTNYAVLEDKQTDGFEANWHVLCMIFEEAPQKLTREDILAEWPTDFDKPSFSALRNWLGRAVDTNMIACEGTGRKKDPFRYWFPAREAYWKKHYLYYELFEQQKKDLHLPFQSLTEKRRTDRESDRNLENFTRELED